MTLEPASESLGVVFSQSGKTHILNVAFWILESKVDSWRRISTLVTGPGEGRHLGDIRVQECWVIAFEAVKL